MSVSVAFSEIVRMLEQCAPGHTMRLATHFYNVKFRDRHFRQLSKFKMIPVGHVKKMCRYLDILDCAEKFGLFQ